MYCSNGYGASFDHQQHDNNHESLLTNNGDYYFEMHANAGYQYQNSHGTTFMDNFNADCHRDQRKSNTFYPFSSRDDWELASWLYNSGISMAEIDRFLSLALVSVYTMNLFSVFFG